LNPLENENDRFASSTHSGGKPDEKADKTLDKTSDKTSDKKPKTTAETTSGKRKSNIEPCKDVITR
jgi:hypothetical protein